MSIFITVAGVIGVVICLLNLVGGLWSTARRFAVGLDSTSLPSTIWMLVTSPVISTICLFTLHHWIFTIPLLLCVAYTLSVRLFASNFANPNFTFLKIQVWVQLAMRLVFTLGVPIVLTLQFTGATGKGTTILSWYLPVFILASLITTWLANGIVCVLLVVSGELMFRLMFRQRM